MTKLEDQAHPSPKHQHPLGSSKSAYDQCGGFARKKAKQIPDARHAHII
jgi:hypothetical protein